MIVRYRNLSGDFFCENQPPPGSICGKYSHGEYQAGHVQRVLEIDTDVLYQWKDLVPTYEERITRIDGIYMKNVVCTSADAIYELKGDAKLPARNVVIEDVHVNEVRDFVKKINNTENVTERNVTYSFSEH